MARYWIAGLLVAPIACGNSGENIAPKAAIVSPVQRVAKCSDEARHDAALMDDALRRYTKARDLAQTGEDHAMKLATDQMQRLCSQYPWFALAHRGLGIVFGFRGNWIASYSAYVRYQRFSIHPADREKVAVELRMLEQKLPALSSFAEAEQLRNDGRLVQATEMIRRVIGMKPQFALAHRTLAQLLAAQDKSADAADAYESYLRLEPFAFDRAATEQLVGKLRALHSTGGSSGR